MPDNLILSKKGIASTFKNKHLAIKNYKIKVIKDGVLQMVGNS